MAMGSADHYLAQNGPSAGTRLSLLRAGNIQAEILPDRGMDIGRLWSEGVQYAWTLPTGFTSPAPLSSSNDWISVFGGGLLTTCGPENFGAASKDGDHTVPTHGSFSQIRFTIIEEQSTERGITLTGRGHYSHLFGDSWEILRGITITSDSNVVVEDTLTNIGYRKQPVLMLYHVNLGGDFLSPQATISSEADVTRYSSTPSFEDDWSTYGSALAVNEETVYVHSFPTPAHTTVSNPELRAQVTVSSDSLPHLFQWKFRRHDRFALGIEPASASSLGGRTQAAAGAPWLDPGFSWSHKLTIALGKTADSAQS